MITGVVETAGPGGTAGTELARGVAVGFGGSGVAIASNSVTVTDLKPFRSN